MRAFDKIECDPGGPSFELQHLEECIKLAYGRPLVGTWANGRAGFEPIFMVYQMLAVLGIWESQFYHLLEL